LNGLNDRARSSNRICRFLDLKLSQFIKSTKHGAVLDAAITASPSMMQERERG
jgi:hypothetical protein